MRGRGENHPLDQLHKLPKTRARPPRQPFRAGVGLCPAGLHGTARTERFPERRDIAASRSAPRHLHTNGEVVGSASFRPPKHTSADVKNRKTKKKKKLPKISKSFQIKVIKSHTDRQRRSCRVSRRPRPPLGDTRGQRALSRSAAYQVPPAVPAKIHSAGYHMAAIRGGSVNPRQPAPARALRGRGAYRVPARPAATPEIFYWQSYPGAGCPRPALPRV